MEYRALPVPRHCLPAGWLLAAMLACSCASAGQQAVKVDIARTADGAWLTRGGQRYPVRGAGMEDGDLATLAAHGGNSIRTWSTAAGVDAVRDLLDRAQAAGVTVALGLPMAPERSGFDYDDAEAVERQHRRLRADVLAHRDHPALLAWIVGNELNLQYRNPRVYDAVDRVAMMIRELDPAHPATTTIAGLDADVVAEIRQRAPALHFLSFQVYGDLDKLPGFLEQTGFDEPFMVTEWGTIGHWEVATTGWGAPIEPTSSEKAARYLDGYQRILAPLAGRLLGDYVFFWGQKQERTPTWYGMFTEEGLETEVIDVMHYLWRGRWPANRVPLVESLTLAGGRAQDDVTLVAGRRYRATAAISDPDGDSLHYRWALKPESRATSIGGDYEAPIENLEGFIEPQAGASVALRAPAAGEYRLFVLATDGQGHAAHANLPFLVVTKTRTGD